MNRHGSRHRTRLGAFGLAAALAAGGLLTLTGKAHAASCSQQGRTVTCTFNNPGAAESFTVPSGLSSLHVHLTGGAGGAGAALTSATGLSTEVQGGGAGGAGGITDTDIPVTPGETLGIFLGEAGGDASGCGATGVGGSGGHSGGSTPATRTGGNGGNGAGGGGAPNQCAAGGGGGGSFIMRNNQTPADIAFHVAGGVAVPDTGSAVPAAVAGGGGGGGGGFQADSEAAPNSGGTGGGTSSGAATNGPGGGNQGEASVGLTATGDTGADGYINSCPGSGCFYGGAGGGGGGGFTGGEAGETGYLANPGTGGGGGGHTGSLYQESLAVTPAAVEPGTTLTASLPTRAVGTTASAAAAIGSPGALTITYTLPGQSATVTTACHPGQNCVANPPTGQETQFHVVATGGRTDAVLIATLNGGPPPQCTAVPGILSPDWLQFGFQNPHDGRTWSKRIRVTGTHPTTKDAARKIKRQTEICFAALYKFVPKHDTPLVKKAGSQFWEAILADCNSREISVAKRLKLDLARPCVVKRSLVHLDGGYVVRIVYKVPKGEDDPQGRSLRKKRRRH